VHDELDLEREIISASAAELCDLAKYVAGTYGDLYKALLTRFALDNLRVIIRLVHSGSTDEETQGRFVDLPRACSPPMEGLLQSPDVRSVLEAIPFPRLRKEALAAMPLYNETGRTAYLEMALGRGYWDAVLRAARPLGRPKPEGSMAPVYAEAAAAAVFGTIRAAATYGIPWERWARLVPPTGRGPGEAALASLYADPTAEHVLDHMPWLCAGEELREPADVASLEDAAWSRCVRLANRQYYARILGPAVLIGYYYLKRQETRSLLGLSQLLRYNTPEPEILEFLGL
jgi:vacuolar-type H+-ATPase subunit C/Vma6